MSLNYINIIHLFEKTIVFARLNLIPGYAVKTDTQGHRLDIGYLIMQGCPDKLITTLHNPLLYIAPNLDLITSKLKPCNPRNSGTKN